MSKKFPISPPASYVTPSAVGFADSAGQLALVSAESPMPVTTAARTGAPPPLAGTADASTVAGPFAPLPDVPIHLHLSGAWTGTVELQRSVDGGATMSGLTAAGMPWARFSGNANEVVWQEGDRAATFYLAVTLASGAIDYRLSQ